MSRRSYKQYCATARALDVVGERWTLLLIRELLTGPKRFGDLQASLAGLGTGLLAARLEWLQDEGLVRQVTLPPPARTPAYALTEAGAELEPAVLALARWGMKWALGERRPDQAFRPGWGVLAMQVNFAEAAARDVTVEYEFRVDGDVFHARIDRGQLQTGHGPAYRPDVVIEADAETFIALTSGRMSVTDAMRHGTASVTGDRKAAQKLPRYFPRPDSQIRTPA